MLPADRNGRLSLPSGEVQISSPRNRAKPSRHHTKDKQRFVVSVIAYASLPRLQRFHCHPLDWAELHKGGKHEHLVDQIARLALLHECGVVLESRELSEAQSCS
jgi:hypothetical protein